MSNAPAAKTRVSWIDAVKGFAILTVVFLHTYNGYTYTGMIPGMILYWVTSFHMALFFVFAGYFFRLPDTTQEIKDKAKKKLKGLIIPYVLWGVIIGFMVDNVRLLIRNKPIEWLDMIWMVLTGRKFFMVVPWFLFALIGVYCVQYLLCLVLKKSRHKNTIWLVINFLLLPLGYFVCRFEFSSYFRLGHVVVSCGFFAFGVVLKRMMEKSEPMKWGKQLCIGLVLLIVGGICCFLNIWVSYANLRFGDVVLHTVSALGTIVGLSLVSRCMETKGWLAVINRPLEFFGKNSVIVFLTHPILLYGIRILESLLKMPIHTFPAIPAFCMVVVAQFVVVRFMPKKLLWTFGKV